MSHLNRLSIEGIRSFQPDHYQALDFYSPLTIILGPNGAGKTTIIEALKYVTTGVMPPNSNSGKTFIHDPVFANKTTVRGQVRLKFVDVEKKSTVVTKSVEINVKKTRGKVTQTFRQINATIKRDNTCIDKRCGDVDIELLSLFGVSKAVLSNVIFCHQEDCNWPLSEGKVLKEKFDDIFGSMGYVKALEKIRKSRQLESQTSKTCALELNTFKVIKEVVDSDRKSLATLNTKLEVHKQTINECNDKLNKIRAELKLIISKEESVQKIDSKISSIEGSIKEKQRALNEIKNSITDIFSGTKDELQNAITNFESNVLKAKSRKESLVIKQRNKMNECNEMIKSQQTITKELGRLEAQEESYKCAINERNQLVLKLCDNYPFDNSKQIIDKIKKNIDLNDSDMEIIETMISSNLQNFQLDLSDEKAAANKKLELFGKELDKYKALKSKCEHEIQLWQKELQTKQNTLKEIQKSMSEVTHSQEERQQIECDLNKFNEQLNQINKTNVNESKEKLINLESDKKSLKDNITDLERRFKKVSEDRDERIKLEMMKKEKDEKEKTLNEFKNDYCDVMSKIGANDGLFHSTLDGYISSLRSKFEKISRNVSINEKELTKKGTTVEISKKQLKKKIQELNESEAKVRATCELEEYDSVLDEVKQEITVLREEISECNSCAPFIKKQVELIKAKQCCSICERSMSDEWVSSYGIKLNQNRVINKLEQQLNNTPQILEKKSKKLVKKEKHFNDLLSLRSTVESHKKLAQEIPDDEKEIANCLKDIDKQRSSHETEKSEMNKLKDELDSMSKLLPNASKYDTIVKELSDLEYKMNRDGWKFDSDTESADDLSKQLTELRTKYDKIDRQITKIRTKIDEYNEKYNMLQNAIQNCEQQKLQIERRMQQRISDEKKIKELEAEIDILDENIENSYLKGVGFDPKIEEIESNKTELNRNLEKIENDVRSKIKDINSKYNDIENINQRIKNYESSGKSSVITELRAKFNEILAKITKIECEKSEMIDEINKVSEEISSIEVRRRELNDNRKLFIYKEEIESQNNLLKEERKKLGYENLIELKRTKVERERDERRVEATKQQAMGNQQPILEQITQLENKLKESKYKNADTNFKKKAIEKIISEMAGDDLNKYYKALDFAVTDFHRRKMKEINKIIEGFWKQAYRGVDIDYIKIVSDEEERSANDKRRSYNYRVVMVKGNSEMDMRGRCSAGQKVLASLIIRLALAEIFSANCCVLALDEPTTNLDKDNISSFANAVSDIVRYRSHDKNLKFQLIIITHDEEFLRCLDDETGQYYYRVCKDVDGYSTIWRKSISDQNDDRNDD